nr:hypothetical protein CFP56_70573 [Quercus suber]
MDLGCLVQLCSMLRAVLRERCNDLFSKAVLINANGIIVSGRMHELASHLEEENTQPANHKPPDLADELVLF